MNENENPNKTEKLLRRCNGINESTSKDRSQKRKGGSVETGKGRGEGWLALMMGEGERLTNGYYCTQYYLSEQYSFVCPSEMSVMVQQ